VIVKPHLTILCPLQISSGYYSHTNTFDKRVICYGNRDF
jgi:hypothetical protein